MTTAAGKRSKKTKNIVYSTTSTRHKWSDKETITLLNLIKDKDISAIIDGKQQRNAIIYKELEKEMLEHGFEKPWDIIRTKWKGLKQAYMAEKRKLSKSGAGGKGDVKVKFWKILDDILGSRPVVTSITTNINSSGKLTLYRTKRSQSSLLKYLHLL